MPEPRQPVVLSGRRITSTAPSLPRDWVPYVWRDRREPVTHCGTERGYQHHRTNNTRPCHECQQAHTLHCNNETNRKRRNRAKEKP